MRLRTLCPALIVALIQLSDAGAATLPDCKDATGVPVAATADKELAARLSYCSLLAANPLMGKLADEDQKAARGFADAVRDAYSNNPSAAKSLMLKRHKSPQAEFDGAPDLEPLYKTNPEAALDLLRRLQAAGSRTE